MIIVGLTGSIAMGKSEATRQLRRMGVPVHDADRSVHDLLAKGGGAVTAVGAAFPGVVVNGAVDRQKLGGQVFGDAAALGRLEAILHPMTRAATRRFLQRCRRQRRHLVALDIPLLFETGSGRGYDAVAVVTCPAFLQEQRVLRRPGMTRAKLDGIRRRQMPDWQKRKRADFVIATGSGKRDSLRRLVAMLAALRYGGRRKRGKRS